MIVDFFKKFKPGDPLRKVCNTDQQNRIANVLNTIQGVNCRVVKTPSGHGWMIVVDGGSDIQPPDGDADWPYPFTGGSGADEADDHDHALNDLTDVTITSPAAYEVICRNAGNTAWINGWVRAHA